MWLWLTKICAPTAIDISTSSGARYANWASWAILGRAAAPRQRDGTTCTRHRAQRSLSNLRCSWLRSVSATAHGSPPAQHDTHQLVRLKTDGRIKAPWPAQTAFQASVPGVEVVLPIWPGARRG
jgi:hypothetical protein